MSKVDQQILDLQMNEAMAQKLSMSYPAFLDWIHSHELEGSNFEQTKEFLAFLGMALYEMWADNIPGLTLDDVAGYVFSEDETTLTASTAN